MTATKQRLCLYCSNPTGRVRKGEHLIPEAIGGRVTTKHVCSPCNNIFSDIDRELCSRSPLSFVAAKEIGGHIWQSWDVDEKSNVLLEGRPDFERKGFKLRPQILIFPKGEQFWADYDELSAYGIERSYLLFGRRIRKAFWQYHSGDKRALHFMRVPQSEGLLKRHHYPPRFFVRGSIAEACQTKTIELGFASRHGLRLAMARIETGFAFGPIARADMARGSGFPTMRNFFDAGKVWRALAKIAVNLLHKYCTRTPVNYSSFSSTVEEIVGMRGFPISRLESSGFVYADDVASIASNTSVHSFRLAWWKGHWHVTMAFFGGQIGAYVSFPGPSKESWRSVDVLAPIGRTEWTATYSSLMIPTHLHVEWLDLAKLIPNGGFLHTDDV